MIYQQDSMQTGFHDYKGLPAVTKAKFESKTAAYNYFNSAG